MKTNLRLEPYFSFLLATLAFGQTPAAQLRPQAIPRMPGGKPNLNGIWQAMSTAYWDLEDHPAQPGAVAQLGAIDAVPAGYGVVEGGKIPYRPEHSLQGMRISRVA